MALKIRYVGKRQKPFFLNNEKTHEINDTTLEENEGWEKEKSIIFIARLLSGK